MALKTLEDVEAELQNDIKVKVAGVDADGVMRGKVMAKDKFLSAAESGFGFCRYTPREFRLVIRQCNLRMGYTRQGNLDCTSFC
jgi:hypothetical protein